MSTPLLRRIGAFGDLHSDVVALERTLDFLRSQNLDAVVCDGDIVDGVGDAERCCTIVREAKIPTVRGNHDNWLLRGINRDLPEKTLLTDLSPANRRWLAQLPATLRFETVRGPLLLCHGLGENDMGHVKSGDYGYALEVNGELQQLIAAREYRFVVCGHTHETMAKSFAGLTILNPGPLLRKHDGLFAIFDFEAGVAQWFEVESFDEVLRISFVSR